MILEDVFPIEKGGFLASYVSFPKGTVSIHTKCFHSMVCRKCIPRSYIYITLTWFIGWLGRKRSFEDLQSRKCAGSSYSSSVRDSKHFKVHALRIF